MSNGPLDLTYPPDGDPGNNDSFSTTLDNGRKTVAVAGTAERLTGTSTPCKEVIITAETDNTGIIVVGSATVVAALATRQGTPLNAGDSIVMTISNANQVYLDTTVNTDGVTYQVIK